MRKTAIRGLVYIITTKNRLRCSWNPLKQEIILFEKTKVQNESYCHRSWYCIKYIKKPSQCSFWGAKTSTTWHTGCFRRLLITAQRPKNCVACHFSRVPQFNTRLWNKVEKKIQRDIVRTWKTTKPLVLRLRQRTGDFLFKNRAAASSINDRGPLLSCLWVFCDFRLQKAKYQSWFGKKDIIAALWQHTSRTVN